MDMLKCQHEIGKEFLLPDYLNDSMSVFINYLWLILVEPDFL